MSKYNELFLLNMFKQIELLPRVNDSRRNITSDISKGISL